VEVVQVTAYITGQVTAGKGKGSYFASLSWFSDQVKTKLGFTPFPGTLNLRLPLQEAVKVQQHTADRLEINPPEPNFCGAVCYPVLIEDLIWGALVRPIATEHPPETVELIAPASVRESLGVAEGDQVKFCWDYGPKTWVIKKEEKLADYRVLEVVKRQAASPRVGKNFDFYILQSADWVQVIPITADNKVLMVRQYRHGTGEITLELPGGIVEPGFKPAEAAQRELTEEIGYISQKLTSIGKVRPNPAILTNWCHLFLAESLVSWEKPQDDGEDVYVLPVPLKNISGLIKSGMINHSLSISCFYHLLAR
jgi:8-oxo-dGTP pyrophosphatase MutT (NUDIX family)